MRVGESATMISVELGHWAGGCTQWICLSREFFSLNQPEWRLLFIFLRVNHPRVSDRTLKRAWQVCLSEITVWCVCAWIRGKRHVVWTSLHMYVSACVCCPLFDFTLILGSREICEQRWNVQLCQQWTPSGRQTDRRDSRTHLATIWGSLHIFLLH